MTRAMAAVLLGALALAGCGEKTQQVSYSKGRYAGKPDTPAWAGNEFKNSRADWERAIKARNLRQNEYERTSGRGG
ncbi:MAG TPA: hypothetical protein VGQ19_05675 [Burkholderiales bacterium]|nr:hypothetical protein [Burkholderiales bacterium]